jgi:acyl CoA:acetate/3-ketoacid CoA transferase alpha subunit
MAKVESKTMKYVDFITRDEKEVKQAEVAVAVKKAAIQVDIDLIKANEAAANAESVIAIVLGRIPFNPSALINAKRDLAEANTIIAELEAIKVELF